MNGQVLRQKRVAASTLTTIYSVAPGNRANISAIIVANCSGTSGHFTIRLAGRGQADSDDHLLYPEISILGNTTFLADFDDPGITMNAEDELRVLGDTAFFTFTIFGQEMK